MCCPTPIFSGKAPKCFWRTANFEDQLYEEVWSQATWLLSRPNCMAKEQCQPQWPLYKAGRTTDVMVVGKPVSLKHSTLSTKIATIVERRHLFNLPIKLWWTIQKFNAYSILLAEESNRNVLFNESYTLTLLCYIKMASFSIRGFIILKFNNKA